MEHKCVKEAEVAALKENVVTLFKVAKENRDSIKQIEERQDMLYEWRSLDGQVEVARWSGGGR